MSISSLVSLNTDVTVSSWFLFSSHSSSAADSHTKARFTTTHWSVVIRAGGAGSAATQAAFERIVPNLLVSTLRVCPAARTLAVKREDLTQAFFARLLEKNYVANAQQEKGRFRTFLLIALKRFLADEWGRSMRRSGAGFRPSFPLIRAWPNRVGARNRRMTFRPMSFSSDSGL